MLEEDAGKKIVLGAEETKLIGSNLLDLAANISNVLKPAQDLIVSFAEVGKRIGEADKGAFQLVGKMGLNEKAAERIKRTFGEAYNELGLIGADFGTFVKTQESFNTATGRNVVLTKENLNDLISINKVTGLAADTLLTSFQNAGFSMSQIDEQMLSVVKLASSMGLNSQVVSKSVTENLEKLNKFGFGNGVEGLAKMAAKAASMRIDMKSAFQVADDIFDKGPEAAIEISATLQRLGATSGALLDPLKLMDLAQNNLPELQNQLVDLSKQYTVFNEDTKQFEIMPGARKQLNEVAKSLGMSYEEFAKMSLESSKMEKKLSEIDFSRFNMNMTEEQKSLITNMAEMNTQGEYVVKVKDEKGVEIEKAISELNQGDLEELQKQTLTEGEKMYDIASQSLSQLERIGNLQETFANSYSTMLATSEYGNTYLQTLVAGNEKLYGVNDASKNETLKLFNLNNEAMKQSNADIANLTKLALEKAQEGKFAESAVLLKELGEQSFGQMKKGLDASYQDKTVASILTDAGINIIAKTGAELVNSFVDFLKTGDLTSFIPKTPQKDIAITADGMHYSLDKGDMLMAINQEKLASAIGASSPSPILPTMVENNYASNEVKKESTPKELNVNINFTHESKGADINVAQEFSKSLRDNTSLQQQLVQQISENIKNYGLTA
jgi:hypothetical protein